MRVANRMRTSVVKYILQVALDANFTSGTGIWPDGKPERGNQARSVVAQCGCRCRANPGTRVRPDIGVVILRCRDSTCGGAWIGVDQALDWCGEWCGLPNPYCRHCAFSTCYAYQISANTEQERFLNWSRWLVGVSTKWYLTRVGSARIVSTWIEAWISYPCANVLFFCGGIFIYSNNKKSVGAK